jgi:hypothetical protein
MISHPLLKEWESQLDQAIDELDKMLEKKYKGLYKLHPARRKRGVTANPSHDGLFSINAQFSLGLGSELGKGYVVDIKMVTLEKVSEKKRDEVEEYAYQKLKIILPQHFKGTNLSLAKDGNVLKIHGDLSLGEL